MKKYSYLIDVDLDVFKGLTARILAEGQDHNDVLRDLLGLDSPIEADQPESHFSLIADVLSKPAATSGFYSRGLLLPNGTKLRARYKGSQYFATIVDDNWIDSSGGQHASPSAAAKAITETSVNGWRFWEAKRPGDLAWRRLDILSAK